MEKTQFDGGEEFMQAEWGDTVGACGEKIIEEESDSNNNMINAKEPSELIFQCWSSLFKEDIIKYARYQL